ncbi:uncharacterized protein LOC128657318 isoform X2 [Bombina bombina]|uniref:uncharacterized protein LOC128657318 isoform X2 n=1 Tax=Bombina bombina TaxID=8345 RepID=UPI00235A5CCC|nr:uncharacterized protein LOC128657318 isoform X2 [Bombina bombina]
MLNKAMSVKNQTSELPDAHGDADNADIGKAEIKEDLCMKRQLGPTDEETSDSISSGRTDVTSSDGSAVEHEEELNVCDQVALQTAMLMLLSVFKIKEATWEIYVLNVGNVLL